LTSLPPGGGNENNMAPRTGQNRQQFGPFATLLDEMIAPFCPLKRLRTNRRTENFGVRRRRKVGHSAAVAVWTGGMGGHSLRYLQLVKS
jgi:hypothetical protein